MSLSGGQKQAVAIARAVHFKRTLLVLDEPTSALAVRAIEALFDYLRSLRTQGLSSVLVTHNLYDAYRICDRFVVMARGQVVFMMWASIVAAGHLHGLRIRVYGEKGSLEWVQEQPNELVLRPVDGPYQTLSRGF